MAFPKEVHLEILVCIDLQIILKNRSTTEYEPPMFNFQLHNYLIL